MSQTSKGVTSAKELKVKLPMEHHIKLHTLKVLKGQSLSSTVERALQRYFEQVGMPLPPQGSIIEALAAISTD